MPRHSEISRVWRDYLYGIEVVYSGAKDLYVVYVRAGALCGHALPPALRRIDCYYDGYIQPGLVEITRSWQEADAVARQLAQRHGVPLITDADIERARGTHAAERQRQAQRQAHRRADDQAASEALWIARGLGPNASHTAKKKWRRANRASGSVT